MEHFYRTIPGWCDFADYYADIVRELSDGARVVEVGVWQGQSTAALAVEILNSGKAIRLDVVDHFLGSGEIPDAQRPADLRAAFDAHIAPVRHAIRTIHAKPSLEAAATYADRSLDFVWLDGDHHTADLARELDAWWPKVKPGGILAGHDLDWLSVQRAVKPWSEKSGVRLLTVSKRSWEMRKPSATVPLSTPHGQRKCLVAVCSNERTVYRQTAQSLMALGWGQRVIDAGQRHGFTDIQFAWIHKFVLVSDLRNEAVAIARAQGCTHLLFLDADMMWPADVLDRMLRHHDQGIVSGLYHLKSWPHWPVALTRARVNPVTAVVDYDYDVTVHTETSLRPENLVGMGCALIPITVFDAVPAPWFEYQTDNHGRWTVTEDVAFCQRAASVGCPIWIDPTVKCGHVAQHAIAEPWYDRALVEMEMLETREREKAVLA